MKLSNPISSGIVFLLENKLVPSPSLSPSIDTPKAANVVGNISIVVNTLFLLFTGNTGLGKTFLSSCIANELLKKDKTVLYQTASVMLDTIISYRFGKPNVSKDIYDYLLNVDLLIIDDLGTEGVNNMKLVELFNILNSRLLNLNKKTIISTNLSLQNLFNTYDERIVSRIIGSYDICYFFGEDIRFIIKK